MEYGPGEPAPGKVKPGTEVVLSHPEEDLVKIYYTLDGSEPDRQSLIYNPSTSYFRPELNKPITVEKNSYHQSLCRWFWETRQPGSNIQV